MPGFLLQKSFGGQKIIGNCFKNNRQLFLLFFLAFDNFKEQQGLR